MDVKLCNKVSKSKLLESKAGPWACPKPPNLCPDYCPLTTLCAVINAKLLMRDNLMYNILP